MFESLPKGVDGKRIVRQPQKRPPAVRLRGKIRHRSSKDQSDRFHEGPAKGRRCEKADVRADPAAGVAARLSRGSQIGKDRRQGCRHENGRREPANRKAYRPEAEPGWIWILRSAVCGLRRADSAGRGHRSLGQNPAAKTRSRAHHRQHARLGRGSLHRRRACPRSLVGPAAGRQARLIMVRPARIRRAGAVEIAR